MVNTGKVGNFSKKKTRIGRVSLKCDGFIKDKIRRTVHGHSFKPPSVS